MIIQERKVDIVIKEDKVINKILEDNPRLVNKDPYGEGWFFLVEMKDTQQLKNLLSYKEYKEVCQTV